MRRYRMRAGPSGGSCGDLVSCVADMRAAATCERDEKCARWWWGGVCADSCRPGGTGQGYAVPRREHLCISIYI